MHAAKLTNGDAKSKSMAGVPREGDVLASKYVVEGLLGTGGMGAVLAARHLTLDERFAVKVLLPEHARNDEVVERFLREGRAAIKVRSEHVVRVVDVDTLSTGLPYLVMEYLEGTDLERLVTERGPLDVPLAVDLVLQACEAIAEAHALGMVHRDLKPANLFLTARADGTPSVKVLDFGISMVKTFERSEPRITSKSAVMGSPEYMAPEQLRSTRNVDARADIWSIGTILHELLTGNPPFPGDTVPEVCATVLKDDAPPLRSIRADVPLGLQSVVLTCLEKDVSRRFDDVAELAVALAPFGSTLAHTSAQRIVRILHTDGVVPARTRLRAMRAATHRDLAPPAAVIGTALALVIGLAGTIVAVRTGTNGGAEACPSPTSSPTADPIVLPNPSPLPVPTVSSPPPPRRAPPSQPATLSRSHPIPQAGSLTPTGTSDDDLFEDRK